MRMVSQLLLPPDFLGRPMVVAHVEWELCSPCEMMRGWVKLLVVLIPNDQAWQVLGK